MASVFKRGGKRAKGYWYVSWFDHNGKRRTKCTRTTDKATAERIARKHEADVALRRDGVIDPILDAISRESKRTIESHLADYESKMRVGNRTENHVNRTIGFVRTISAWAGFAIASDINADAVNRYAGKLKDEGRSARTIQSHLTGIKGFTKWLAENHKLPRDPLTSVKKPNPQADRRYERRMLLPEEWQRLKAVTEAGPERYGMTGTERVLLYETAIQTGLRSYELRSLTRGRLVPNADPPHITAKARNTKKTEDARQYIQPELASDLRTHITTKAPKAPIFNLPHETNMAAMLRADLAETRKAWFKEAKDDPDEYARREESDFLADVNHEGELIDFHSLRHTCGSWLAMTGAHPKVVQTVMRHSTIVLTMDTYGHLFPGQEADAVARLGEMLGAELPEVELATGTDDLTVFDPNSAQRLAQRARRETGQNRANRCDEGSQPRAEEKSPKPLQIADSDSVSRDVAMTCESRPGGIRTPDQGIMSPLL